MKITGFPTFGVHSDDMVYLVSKVESDDKNTWIVGVDLGKKTLEVIKPYSAARAIRSNIPSLYILRISEYNPKACFFRVINLVLTLYFVCCPFFSLIFPHFM